MNFLENIRELISEETYLLPTDVPGKLGVFAGKLEMERPKGRGAWPVLYPSEDVRLLHKGQLLSRPTVVENPSDVSIVAVHKEPTSEYQIVVSPDKMKVSLKVRFTPGMKYEICDADFTRKLRVKTRPVGEILPEPIDPKIVMQELQERKFHGRIHYETVLEACRGMEDAEVVILEGVPFDPPVDGVIEKTWGLQPKALQESSSAQINHRERMTIESVDVGEVLAYWYPPEPGRPGRNVYGETVEPPKPKNDRFRAGRGVKLINNGRVAVADKPGRPLLRNGTLTVTQQMIVEGDVDLSTGNIKFKGDVIVLGNVRETMKIEAGGVVEVKGDVTHAHIISGSHVIVKRKVIGSTICAGHQHMGLIRSMALVKAIEPEFDMLIAACEQLQRHPKFCTEDLSHSGIGYLIKLLLEMRFPQITKNFAKLVQLLGGVDAGVQEEEVLVVAAELSILAKNFVGAGPLAIPSMEALKSMRDKLQDLGQGLHELLEFPASIRVDYCQNATLEATGSIFVSGSLVYGSNMVSGDRITILGECRGGTYYAKTAISAGIVGAEGMVETSLAVGEGGTIGAKKFFPGVKLRIGSSNRVTTTMWHNHTFGGLENLSTETISE